MNTHNFFGMPAHRTDDEAVRSGVVLPTYDGKRILVVEDEAPIRETIREYLARCGYEVKSAINGREALVLLNREEYDVVITDLAMPVMDGFEMMREALKIQPMTPIVILSGQSTFENALQAIQMGAYDFITKPVVDFGALRVCINRGLERKSFLVLQKEYQQNLERIVADQSAELVRKNKMLRDYAERLEEVSVSTIGTLQVALEEKDTYTAGHSQRVTDYCLAAGKQLDLSDEDLWVLATGAKLHDIGKMLMDTSYIHKPGALTDVEWMTMKQHPVVADRILGPLPFLREVRPLVRHHHERLDGSGYPDGLVGDEIDLLTMILAVADSFDAMTSRRSYRPTLTSDEAIEELRRCSGRLYREEAVQGLLAALDDLPETQGDDA